MIKATILSIVMLISVIRSSFAAEYRKTMDPDGRVHFADKSSGKKYSEAGKALPVFVAYGRYFEYCTKVLDKKADFCNSEFDKAILVAQTNDTDLKSKGIKL